MEIKPLIRPDGDVTEQTTDSLLDLWIYGVDNDCQVIRRRINMLERPITCAANGLRWNGYAAYNPKRAAMLVETLRVYNNYVHTDAKTSKNKESKTAPTTPAQKIGFPSKRCSVDDILSFSPLTV